MAKGESRCPGGPAQTWGTQEDKELLGVKGPCSGSCTEAGSECQQREVTLGSRKVSTTENPRTQEPRATGVVGTGLSLGEAQATD